MEKEDRACNSCPGRKSWWLGSCVVTGEMTRGEYPLEAALFCLLTTLLSNTRESISAQMISSFMV